MSHGADRIWGRVADTARFFPKQAVCIPVVVGPLHPGCSHPGHPKVQMWYRPPGSRPLNTVQEKRRLARGYPLTDAHLTKGSGKHDWTVKLRELRVWEDLLGTSGSKGQRRGHSGCCYLDEGCVQEEAVRELRRPEGFSGFHIHFPEVHGRPWAPDSAVCQRPRFSLAPLALVHCSS